jgi:hypothetical protein
MRRFAGVLLAIPLTLAAVGAAAEVQRTAAPPGAKVYFIQPTDGSTVPQTFTVKFGLENMGVAPAGTDKPATGHHHLLIDRDLPPLDQPMGGDIMHFGGGQTEAQVTLPPGTHTLQLLLGDMNHVPHDPPIYSDKISITVQ